MKKEEKQGANGRSMPLRRVALRLPRVEEPKECRILREIYLPKRDLVDASFDCSLHKQCID